MRYCNCNTLIILTVLTVLYCASPAARAALLYSNDFEGVIGPEWSETTTSVTPIGARRFLGVFRNDTVNLNLDRLPAHDTITLSLEWFLIGSWDGNTTGVGPDIMDISVVGGPTLLHSTFTVFPGFEQTYPNPFPGSPNPALTGASEIDTLGFVPPYFFGEAVYQFSFTFAHTASSLGINFSGILINTGFPDEAWGLDNIKVSTSRAAATVAYWRFEEGIAGRVASGVDSILDSSGHGLHGTPFGAPVYQRVSNPQSFVGLEVNGIDARVFIPDHVLLELTQSLTLEAYIQIHAIPPANQDFTEIVFRGDDRGALDPYSLALIPDGRLVFHVADTFNNIADVVSPFPLPLDQPLHVAGTLDDATGAQKLFINGQEVASQMTHIRPFGVLDPALRPGVGIGGLQSTLLPQFFDGIIDEVRISNVALTPSEFLPPPLVGGVINDFVSFEPISSTFTFTPDPAGCPAGFAGTFRFAARLTAKASSPSLTDLQVQVQTLTNGNLLQNADGGPGGVGATVTVPQADAFADGILSPAEAVDVPFVVCLQQISPFRFFVDVVGIVSDEGQEQRAANVR